MRYREHAPAPSLRSQVACYWTLRGAPERASAHRVLPDGCMDLLFDLEGDPAARVIGVMSRAVVTEAATAGARVDLLGVRFRAGEAAAYLATAACSVRDQALALRDVCGRWGAELSLQLREADVAARVALLDAALAARPRAFAPDHRLRKALVGLGGDVSVPELARSVGMSERQLRRLFDEHVGQGPRAYARTLRLQGLVRSLDALGPSLRPRWAELALRHGFADQAHLVREVRDLTGVTPTVLWRERAAARLGVSETFNPPPSVVATLDA